MQGTITSPWQFLGRRYTLGLYHFNNRDYDPRLGSWTTPDPAGLIDGPNLYAYVKNSPWQYTDPYGLYMEETMDFLQGFAHGCLDGLSFGGYSALGGSFEPRTSFGAWGEGAGALASLITPMGLASTEIKACVKTVQVASKAFKAEQTLAKAAQIQCSLSSASLTAVTSANEFSLTSNVFSTVTKVPSSLARCEKMSSSLGLLSESGKVAKEGLQFGKQNPSHKISELEGSLSGWLGKETKMIINKAADTVFLSKDGTRKVRFDLNHPAPHSNPHGHIEEFINGRWNKSGPIYPCDVPHF